MNYPIKGFLETSFSDWPGKMAAVLFLPSCNFRCPFCHNHELVLRPQELPDYPLGEIVKALRRRRGWIDGICLTGGEPTLHAWLPALIRDLKPTLGALRMDAGIKLGYKQWKLDGNRGRLFADVGVEGLYLDLSLQF